MFNNEVYIVGINIPISYNDIWGKTKYLVESRIIPPTATGIRCDKIKMVPFDIRKMAPYDVGR